MSEEAETPKTEDTQPEAAQDENELWLTDEELPGEFNWNWRQVITGLMEGKPGYIAYAEAYEIDINESEKRRRVAESNYSQLLRNTKFRALWKRVLEEAGFNDDLVDSRLIHFIIDPGTPVKDAVVAIKHFNELRGRVIRRTDLTSGDKPLPIMGGTAVLPVDEVVAEDV